MMECIYLGEEKRDGVYHCKIYESCTKEDRDKSEFPSCQSCEDKLNFDDKDFAEKFKDNLEVRDRFRNKTHSLRNLLAGRPSFLLGGGPSAKSLPLERLRDRGFWSMAVNNMAGHFHANAFVCSDPPSKFHNGIWLDPSIMKFVPIPKLSGNRSTIREKVDGEFRQVEYRTDQCPNVWGFGRRTWMEVNDTFFTDDHAAWGNMDAGVERTGEKKTSCTLLLALRLLYYLGSRTIYLIGVDFGMAPGWGYSFNQNRDEAACQSNNSQFSIVNYWLCRLRCNGVFDRFGLQIFNCNGNSNLEAFEYRSFDEAIQYTLEGFPEEPFDLEGWYEKK